MRLRCGSCVTDHGPVSFFMLDCICDTPNSSILRDAPGNVAYSRACGDAATAANKQAAPKHVPGIFIRAVKVSGSMEFLLSLSCVCQCTVHLAVSKLCLLLKFTERCSR